MRASQGGLFLVIIATLGFGGFGLWWMFIRNPIETPQAALEVYAEARAERSRDKLVPCMYVDELLFPDAEKRKAEREKLADKHIGIAETVISASEQITAEVISTSVVSQGETEAQGKMVLEYTSTTGTVRREFDVTLKHQDEGWRVYQVLVGVIE